MCNMLRTLTDGLCKVDMALDGGGVCIIGLSSFIIFIVGCAKLICH